MSAQHHINIRTGTEDGCQAYAAHCSCGYAGRSFDNRRDATNDGDEHVVCITRSEP